MNQSNVFTYEIQENEYWYGPIINDGGQYPLHKASYYEAKLALHTSPNQANPFLVSTKGRYIWCESGFDILVKDGIITLTAVKAQPQIGKVEGGLREAFSAASAKFFPANGIMPPKDFFVKPQYNTWIELIYDQTQEGVLTYARSVAAQGMPVGIMMIDDGWNEYYGKWEFNRAKFPDPKAMVETLHEMGFKVMLWTCPFVSPDSLEFRQLKAKGYLVKNQDGSVAIKEWWNGHSAVLDLTHPEAVAWYHTQNHRLMADYGIDGFKFDAGDAQFYSDHDVTYAPIDANTHSELWAKIGLDYEYNEYRACFKAAGLHLVQRLADKAHSWCGAGVASLVPNQLAQGIMGYAYTCPDMIGGGEYMNFLANSDHLDQELFVRYAQCAAMMPMMQFSAAPWRVLDETHFGYCKDAAWIHVKYADYIEELAKRSSQTGEPIVRYMAYEFPEEGLELTKDQFMLGDRYLVAPVLTKDMRMRTVKFPTGQWRGDDGSVVAGPTVRAIEVPLGRLPIYERTK
ncbi:MAG: glycoside hydrolase family 31 protein [Cellulosilyticaceae bacterium]